MSLADTKIFAIRPMLLLAAFTLLVFTATAQVKSPTPRPKEVLKDPDGNIISNNEFRDYSMSEPLRRDPFTRTTLPDGTVELKLNRNSIEGRTAPAFTVRTIDGKVIGPAETRGKVLVLNFWFIGCPVCRAERPKLKLLEEKHRNEDVMFIAFGLDRAAAITDFIGTSPFNYLQVAQSKEIVDLFGVDLYPKNIVIGRDGKIAYWRTTVAAWDQFGRVITTELEKKRNER